MPSSSLNCWEKGSLLYIGTTKEAGPVQNIFILGLLEAAILIHNPCKTRDEESLVHLGLIILSVDSHTGRVQVLLEKDGIQAVWTSFLAYIELWRLRRKRQIACIADFAANYKYFEDSQWICYLQLLCSVQT